MKNLKKWKTALIGAAVAAVSLVAVPVINATDLIANFGQLFWTTAVITTTFIGGATVAGVGAIKNVVDSIKQNDKDVDNFLDKALEGVPLSEEEEKNMLANETSAKEAASKIADSKVTSHKKNTEVNEYAKNIADIIS